ncbi:MAG: type II toxin-antitoxin system YafQ family toxin [Eubacterium sp.]|nr:type II toxin-antitoxin system YafQ family toxin [Eubacterium sp.]
MSKPPLTLKQTTGFRKDLCRMIKRGANLNLLDEVVTLLLAQKPLPTKYKDHPLTGNWIGYRDCHIEPDWILIYRIEEKELVLLATRTGSHSDLFRK